MQALRRDKLAVGLVICLRLKGGGVNSVVPRNQGPEGWKN